MRPSISKISGSHLTARDKRTILDVISYLKNQEYHNMWLGFKGSPKRFCVIPDPEEPNIYKVRIRENYTSDWGEKRQREWKSTVKAKGIEQLAPVPHREDPQADLFEGLAQ